MPYIKDPAGRIDSAKAIPQFADECVVRSGERLSSTVLYRAFHDWIKSCGMDYVCSHNEFSRRFADQGFAKKKSDGIKWLGVSLRTPE